MSVFMSPPYAVNQFANQLPGPESPQDTASRPSLQRKFCNNRPFHTDDYVADMDAGGSNSRGSTFVIDTANSERRQHNRIPRVVTLQLRHQPSDRDIPARTLDISDGGMLMCVPATAPVAVGQPVRIQASQDTLPRLPVRTGPCDSDGLEAKIVRVDRNALLTSGQLQIGIRLENRCHFLVG
jgi:hypothetical protein